jgi:hypothetical protein
MYFILFGLIMYSFVIYFSLFPFVNKSTRRLFRVQRYSMKIANEAPLIIWWVSLIEWWVSLIKQQKDNFIPGDFECGIQLFLLSSAIILPCFPGILLHALAHSFCLMLQVSF